MNPAEEPMPTTPQTPRFSGMKRVAEGMRVKHRRRRDDAGHILTGVVGVVDGEFVIAWGNEPVTRLDAFDIHPSSLGIR